jgi:hypothetical protein
MMTRKRKRLLLQLLFNVVASTFVGICVYGMIIYWDVPKKIDPILSVGLGFIAVLCVGLIYVLGTAIDKVEGEIYREKKGES